MGEAARQALFASHASPEDNAFTLWLGAKLTALGYDEGSRITGRVGEPSRLWSPVTASPLPNGVDPNQ
jgi:hypothetical protein